MNSLPLMPNTLSCPTAAALFWSAAGPNEFWVIALPLLPNATWPVVAEFCTPIWFTVLPLLSETALVPCIVLVPTHGGFACFRTKRLRDHILRAGSQFASMICIFTAFRMMPLADAVAIQFASPLFLTVLSIFLLGERVGIHRWSAVLVGFAGVLIMVQPGPGMFESGALFALVNAVMSASVTIAMRRTIS